MARFAAYHLMRLELVHAGGIFSAIPTVHSDRFHAIRVSFAGNAACLGR
jgi:hypothetical protein